MTVGEIMDIIADIDKIKEKYLTGQAYTNDDFDLIDEYLDYYKNMLVSRDIKE